jgi:hypothetical protein
MFGIQARDGRSVAIFRRGPSRHFLLLRWWLESDSFEEGQWVKSKVYVRRCDLSYDGDLLIYFAARHTGSLYSWTAVSRSPYFTALALWPKGDSWGGGGLFGAGKTIHLNHKPEDMHLARESSVPTQFNITPLGSYPGQGEDGYIEWSRMSRDGWSVVQEGNTNFDFGRKPFIVIDPPYVYEKRNPQNASVSLRLVFFGVGEGNEKHVLENYEIVGVEGRVLRKFEKFDWADWAANGDLLLANAGCVFRLPSKSANKTVLDPFEDCKMLIDLCDRKFEARESPGWARQWP